MTRIAPFMPLIGAALLSACASSSGWTDSAARIENDIRTLASDAFEGREAGTPGFDRAADYVENAFIEIGLQPGGDNGTYRQQVPLRVSIADMAASSAMAMDQAGASTALTPFRDFIMSANPVHDNISVSGEVVFVGYGVDAPSFGLNAYDGVDVDGKIVLVLAGVPDGLPSEERAHLSSTRTKTREAAARGAVGVLLMSARVGTFSDAQLANIAARPNTSVVHPAGTVPQVDAAALLTNAGVDELMTLAGMDAASFWSGEAASQDLGISVTLNSTSQHDDFMSPNLIGVLPGSDPILADEYVVLTAHLDHIGMLNTVERGADTINNGAMDNASGTATLLEEARKFQAAGVAPRRSLLFVALTAEEKGLLGSEYFANSPTVPARSMIANVNLDMPILLHDFVDVIAFGAEHSTLGGLVETAAASMDITLSPDPVPNQALFVRSDHYNFVKVGVPSVFLALGFENGGEASFQSFLRTHYHRPSDDTSVPIMFDVAAKFAELNFRITRAIANADERPEWNEGDYFGDAFAPRDGM